MNEELYKKVTFHCGEVTAKYWKSVSERIDKERERKKEKERLDALAKEAIKAILSRIKPVTGNLGFEGKEIESITIKYKE